MINKCQIDEDIEAIRWWWLSSHRDVRITYEGNLCWAIYASNSVGFHIRFYQADPPTYLGEDRYPPGITIERIRLRRRLEFENDHQ